ncbi:MAG: hypothetical protein ACK56I_26095, partial [bacterium]
AAVWSRTAAGRAIRFTSRFGWQLGGEGYPAGCHGSRRREVPEAHGGGIVSSGSVFGSTVS